MLSGMPPAGLSDGAGARDSPTPQQLPVLGTSSPATSGAGGPGSGTGAGAGGVPLGFGVGAVPGLQTLQLTPSAAMTFAEVAQFQLGAAGGTTGGAPTVIDQIRASHVQQHLQAFAGQPPPAVAGGGALTGAASAAASGSGIGGPGSASGPAGFVATQVAPLQLGGSLGGGTSGSSSAAGGLVPAGMLGALSLGGSAGKMATPGVYPIGESATESTPNASQGDATAAGGHGTHVPFGLGGGMLLHGAGASGGASGSGGAHGAYLPGMAGSQGLSGPLLGFGPVAPGLPGYRGAGAGAVPGVASGMLPFAALAGGAPQQAAGGFQPAALPHSLTILPGNAPQPHHPAAAAATAAQQQQRLLTYEQMRGKMALLAREQHGCRSLQALLQLPWHEEAVQQLYVEIKRDIVELMSDPYGNFFVQRLFETAPSEARCDLASCIAPHFSSVARSHHGTFAAQKLVDCLRTKEERHHLLRQSHSWLITMCLDQHSAHVINKLLATLPADERGFIYEGIAANIVSVANHRVGCTVIQRCIERAADPTVWQQRATIVHAVLKNFVAIVMDPAGCYVIVCLVDRLPARRLPLDAIAAALVGTAARFRKHFVHPHAARIVERVVGRCSMEPFAALAIRLMLADKVTEEMLADGNGSFVLQAGLNVACAQFQAALKAVKEGRELPPGSPEGPDAAVVVAATAVASAAVSGEVTEVTETAAESSALAEAEAEAEATAGPAAAELRGTIAPPGESPRVFRRRFVAAVAELTAGAGTGDVAAASSGSISTPSLDSTVSSDDEATVADPAARVLAAARRAGRHPGLGALRLRACEVLGPDEQLPKDKERTDTPHPGALSAPLTPLAAGAAGAAQAVVSAASAAATATSRQSQMAYQRAVTGVLQAMQRDVAAQETPRLAAIELCAELVRAASAVSQRVRGPFARRLDTRITTSRRVLAECAAALGRPDLLPPPCAGPGCPGAVGAAGGPAGGSPLGHGLVGMAGGMPSVGVGQMLSPNAMGPGAQFMMPMAHGGPMVMPGGAAMPMMNHGAGHGGVAPTVGLPGLARGAGRQHRASGQLGASGTTPFVSGWQGTQAPEQL